MGMHRQTTDTYYRTTEANRPAMAIDRSTTGMPLLATDSHRSPADIHRHPTDTNHRATLMDRRAPDICRNAPDIRQRAMCLHRETIDAHRPAILPNRLAGEIGRPAGGRFPAPATVFWAELSFQKGWSATSLARRRPGLSTEVF
jgi:hypothetical protein